MKTKTILIIDDDPISVESICRILKEHNYNVISVYNSKDAYTLLKEHPTGFDLILIDRLMPSNGINLLEKIKQNPKLKEIPCIIESGSEDIPAYFTARELGAIDVWYKPISEKFLLYAIHEILD